MKPGRQIAKSFLLGILLILTPLAGFATGANSDSWKIVGPGGGGTTIGPTISPHDPSLVVEHCDMTGGYVTSNNGTSWHMFNLNAGVTSVAFDPVDPQVIYATTAALWKSSDAGRTWKMLFPNPARDTVEHQLGDHSDYVLTTSDPVYPGGDITAITVAPGSDAKNGQGSVEHFYLSFEKRGQPAVIVSSVDGGATWKRLATMAKHVVLLTAQNSDLIAVSGSSAWRIGPDGGHHRTGQHCCPHSCCQRGAVRRRGMDLCNRQGRKVYLSQDSGVSFKPVTPALGQSAGNFQAIATSDSHPEVAYVGFRGLQIGEGKENLYNGIAKTTDSGNSWKIVFKESDKPAANLSATWIEQRAGQGNHNIWFDSPYSLGVAPTNPDVAYATDLFRTYRTLDGGATWQEMNSEQLKDGSWVSRGLDVTTNYGVQFDPFDSKAYLYG